MPLQGSLVVIADVPNPALVGALTCAGAFPVIESNLADAGRAIVAALPEAIVLADASVSANEALAYALTKQISAKAPFIPVIARVRDDTPAYRPALPVHEDSPLHAETNAR